MRTPYPRTFLLAAGAILLTAAADPEPPLLTIQRFYQGAMECKVRVEALEGLNVSASGRKKVAKALAYWTGQERIAAAKLGKNAAEIMKDEALFGLRAAAEADPLAGANGCVTAARIGMNYRKRGTPY